MPWSENNKQLHQQSVKDSHMTQAVTMTTSEVEECLISEVGRKGTSGFGGRVRHSWPYQGFFASFGIKKPVFLLLSRSF